MLEALELAHSEITRLCEAQEDLQRQVGKPKWLDLEMTSDLGDRFADRLAEQVAPSDQGLVGGVGHLEDMVRPPNHRHEARRMVEQLTQARLVTLDGDAVVIAHEAVATAWPRLDAWLEEVALAQAA